MAVNVIELRNPYALSMPEMMQVLHRSFDGLLCPGGVDDAIEDFARMVVSKNHGVFVGVEEGSVKALLVVQLPTLRICPYPWVMQFYSEGSGELRRAIASKALEFVQQRGHNKVWAINFTGAPLAVWERALVPKEMKAQSLGEAIMLEVRE